MAKRSPEELTRFLSDLRAVVTHGRQRENVVEESHDVVLSVSPMHGEMPKRPRSHQLETESRDALRGSIPRQWVFRDMPDDYGLDAQIEIFSQKDEATGMMFFVQLKATDQEDLSRALRLRLPTAKCNYYAALQLPTLIVRYHAPTRQLFAQWFHRKEADPAQGKAASVAFQLEESDVWTELTPTCLVQEVKGFQRLSSARFAGPLLFSLRIDGGTIGGVPDYRVFARLRQAAAAFSMVISFGRGDQLLPNRVTISDVTIEIAIAGTRTFVLGKEQGWTVLNAEASLVHDVMLAISLAIDKLGFSAEASAIAVPSLAGSNLIHEPRHAFALALCLARSNQMHHAFALADAFFANPSTLNAAQALLWPLLSNHLDASLVDREHVVRLLHHAAKVATDRGEITVAAVLIFNVAGVLSGMSRFREAIRAYRVAGRLEPRYLQEARFWRGLAGTLFRSHRYSLSATTYQCSLKLEDERLTRLLWADALMFSGRYADAETVFAEILAAPVAPQDSEWALKAKAMSWLRSETRLNEQKRRSPAFPTDFGTPQLSDSETMRLCRAALQCDALCALAWFNLGGGYLRGRQPDAAVMAYLLAALLIPWDLSAWSSVVTLAYGHKDVNLAALAVCTAHRINGEPFLEELAARFPAEGRAEVLGLFSELADSVQSGALNDSGREPT